MAYWGIDVIETTLNTLNRVKIIASTARHPLSDHQIKVFSRYWRRYGIVPGYVQSKIFSIDHVFKFPVGYRYIMGDIIVQALSLPDRLKIKYKYARDYAYDVFTRWERRYRRYLPIFVQDDRLKSIRKRWGWPDTINVKTHYLYQRGFSICCVDGEYNPVNVYSGIKCRFCGGPAYTYERLTTKGYGWDYFREDYIREGSRERCYNKNCLATREWASRTGELYEIGRKLKISCMPGWFKRYKFEQDPELKIAIASIAMVDFAAKVKAKLDTASDVLELGNRMDLQGSDM